jgi:predicted MFS family arabinose efflux permease
MSTLTDSGTAGLIIFAYLSDRLRDRSALIIVAEVIGLIGLVVMIEAPSLKLRYAFAFISLSGALSGGPLIVCWLIDNSPLAVGFWQYCPS